MTFQAAGALRCPIDQNPLQLEDGVLRCEDKHSFDVARQGYVNLLSASDKRSKDPGDSKAMVAARRAFLSEGHYQPIADAVSAMVVSGMSANQVVMDAGCGEGYYLERLVAELHRQDCAPKDVIAFDISKWAVQAAARQFTATWLVASNRNIPIAEDSVDVLLSLFGFPVYESFRSVMKPGGRLLLANAGPRHLLELREVIYDEVMTSPSTDYQQAIAAGFTLQHSEVLEYQITLGNARDIQHLLGMTPHLFRTRASGRARAEALNELNLTVAVEFHLLELPV